MGIYTGKISSEAYLMRELCQRKQERKGGRLKLMYNKTLFLLFILDRIGTSLQLFFAVHVLLDRFPFTSHPEGTA